MQEAVTTSRRAGGRLEILLLAALTILTLIWLVDSLLDHHAFFLSSESLHHPHHFLFHSLIFLVQLAAILFVGYLVRSRRRLERRLQQALSLSRDALRRGEELNRRLQQQTAALSAANQELEAFSYSLSHDLRGPLARLYAAAQELSAVPAEKCDEDARFLLDCVCRGAEEMEALIEAMLRLAGIATGKVERERTDLGAMARRIAVDLQRSEPDRQVDLWIGDDLTVTVDASLFRVVLENLLGNAWKFTRRQASARIEFGKETRGEGPIFFVRDNGPGFASDQAAEIFSPFKRLHGKEEFPGCGIGLATVQRIVNRHGGRVWAEGAPGLGATFYFTVADAGTARTQSPSADLFQTDVED